MTDFIAKARANRVIALGSHRSGTTMFFPEDAVEQRLRIGRQIPHAGKPMFMRSRSSRNGAYAKVHALDTVANRSVTPFSSTRDHAA